ncbi:MAG: aminomethyl-transferring glycine dehydrogenase, partial [Calditrichaeota bacterium]|nr:aminomethyl-transferring glycine dehydrogenase [Calditrichota bacterium]
MNYNELFDYQNEFKSRHNGPRPHEVDRMIQTIGVKSLDQLIDETIPADIRLKTEMKLPQPESEYQFLTTFKSTLAKNKVFKSFIGMGYYPTITPSVILRNILENPGWYTQYTPYQSEISQGRLESLINFQTMVCDLTGMDIANASLLDEATAAAEAMSMVFSLRSKELKDATVFYVDDQVFPQTLDVLKTRSKPLGIEIQVGDFSTGELPENVFGVLFQYPDMKGNVRIYENFCKSCQDKQIKIVIAADLLSLTLLKEPAAFAADVVVGTTQRFGVPMGFGGPHAAYFATKEDYKRSAPGRIIGVSIDADGNIAYRMALQTREQHIRRDKATSNICTAQALLANIAAMYAVYHGPSGLKKIAERIHFLAVTLAKSLEAIGIKQTNPVFFDTIHLDLDTVMVQKIRQQAELRQLNFNYFNDGITIAIAEPHQLEDIEAIVEVFAYVMNKKQSVKADQQNSVISDHLKRKSTYLQHLVFNSYHSETDMMRYLKHLENKDLSLTHSMISLGSCTMKLNAATEMIPVTWREAGEMHPFVPMDQAAGYLEMIHELEEMLKQVTGFDGMSLQPNAGAQGEYAGLLVIKAYLESIGEGHRDVCLIPSSAHGTNPASAVMAGMKVVVVKCEDNGNIDLEDLNTKIEKNQGQVAALMVTYPSTHGVFEDTIKTVCQLIHQAGGQVYMDGANMNAQVGLS